MDSDEKCRGDPVIDPEVEAIGKSSDSEAQHEQLLNAKSGGSLNEAGNQAATEKESPGSSKASEAPKVHNAKWRRVEWYTKYKENQALRIAAAAARKAAGQQATDTKAPPQCKVSSNKRQQNSKPKQQIPKPREVTPKSSEPVEVKHELNKTVPKMTVIPAPVSVSKEASAQVHGQVQVQHSNKNVRNNKTNPNRKPNPARQNAGKPVPVSIKNTANTEKRDIGKPPACLAEIPTESVAQSSCNPGLNDNGKRIPARQRAAVTPTTRPSAERNPNRKEYPARQNPGKPAAISNSNTASAGNRDTGKPPACLAKIPTESVAQGFRNPGLNDNENQIPAGQRTATPTCSSADVTPAAAAHTLNRKQYPERQHAGKPAPIPSPNIGNTGKREAKKTPACLPGIPAEFAAQSFRNPGLNDNRKRIPAWQRATVTPKPASAAPIPFPHPNTSNAGKSETRKTLACLAEIPTECVAQESQNPALNDNGKRIPAWQRADMASTSATAAPTPSTATNVVKEKLAKPGPLESDWPVIPEFESTFFNKPKFVESNGQRRLRKQQVTVQTHMIEDPSYFEDIPGMVLTSDIIAIFDCGHKLRININPSIELPDDLQIHCPAPCRRFIDRCGHPCAKLCREVCGTCPRTSWRTYPCGHETLVKCSEYMTPQDICQYPVQVMSPCGHNIWISCSLKGSLRPKDLAKMCTAPCDQALPKDGTGCGHPCKGNCSQCQQGRFHIRCQEPCGRNLICRHVCTSPCRKACPPCKAACEMRCEHGVCDRPCGSLCAKCEEPCIWECPHKKCTKTCPEICDREPCDEPCPKILPCGHPCVSFCGEPCPSLCRICHHDELLVGLIYSKDFVEPSDRFVLLPDCGHAIEREMLDEWMNVQNVEIHHKSCPLCSQVIYRCRRYVSILYTTQTLVARVKSRVGGTLVEFMEAQKNLHAILCFPPGLDLSRFIDMKDFVSEALPYDGVLEENSIYSDHSARELECMVELAKIWLEAEEKVAALDGNIPAESVQLLEYYYKSLFRDIESRELPLRPLELHDLHRELNRFHDMIQLYERQSKRRSQATQALMQTTAAVVAFSNALEILMDLMPYDASKRDSFKFALWQLDDLLRCTLGITDEERAQILQAIDLPSGRWFKCPNGHIYLITECGGAMQVSRCNECGVKIGGRDHRVVQGNLLATEMDGALQPAYPGSVPDPD